MQAASNPKVSMERNVTMARVVQHCHRCQKKFNWQSQPFVLRRYPAGNILLSFAAFKCHGDFAVFWSKLLKYLKKNLYSNMKLLSQHREENIKVFSRRKNKP